MENNNREERILNSLEGLKKVEAPDFFYTRLMGRMQNAMPEQTAKPSMRPVFLTISLSVVLLLNIIALTNMNMKSETKKVTPGTGAATIQSFANAYNLNTESVYE